MLSCEAISMFLDLYRNIHNEDIPAKAKYFENRGMHKISISKRFEIPLS